MTSVNSTAQRVNTTAATQRSQGSGGPNDILSRYQPTGAGKTAQQDGLPPGVASSHRMAQTDLPRLQKYKADFEAVGQKYGIPPAVLAGIASRETRGRAVDSTNSAGAYGLMQVNVRAHPEGNDYGPDSRQHIDTAAKIFKNQWDQVKKDHPDWPPEQQLRGAIAAYNFGPDDVRTISGMDRGTDNDDYSNDVWARSQALAPHFGGAPGTGGTSGSSQPATQFPAFDGKYTAAPSQQDVQSGKQELKIGHRGEAVGQVQDRLVEQGYLKKEDVGQDRGFFGPKTRAAVDAFQKDKGLTPPAGKEGVVGATTLSWLQNGGKKPDSTSTPAQPKPPSDDFNPTRPGEKQYTPAPALADVKAGTATLKQGMQGQAVEQLQSQLVKHGYMTQAQVDTGKGIFGPQTKAAVDAFQQDKGLRPPPGQKGVVGKTTYEALEKPPATTGLDGLTISAQGRQQMQNLAEVARRNSEGKRPDGKCLWHVNNWLDRNSYAQIGDGKSPRLPYAKDYGNWLNNNYQRLGLQKLNLTDPYKAPAGAIIVVRPGTPGTRHPVAGDITVAGGNGKFYNGGNMGYGGAHNFPPGNQHVIGIFVPR